MGRHFSLADGTWLAERKKIVTTHSIVEEKLDVTLVAGVEEDGAAISVPPGVVHQVTHLEDVIVGETEVVHLEHRGRAGHL